MCLSTFTAFKLKSTAIQVCGGLFVFFYRSIDLFNLNTHHATSFVWPEETMEPCQSRHLGRHGGTDSAGGPDRAPSVALALGQATMTGAL